MEPTTTAAATGFAMSKAYSGLAALFFGLVVMFLRKKPTLKNHGRAASGAIVGGVSVGSGVIFSGSLAVYLGMDPNDANTAMAVGGFIGLFAVGIITLVANLLDKTENKDALEVLSDVRKIIGGGKSQDKTKEPTTAPTKKPTAKSRKPRAKAPASRTRKTTTKE